MSYSVEHGIPGYRWVVTPNAHDSVLITCKKEEPMEYRIIKTLDGLVGRVVKSTKDAKHWVGYYEALFTNAKEVLKQFEEDDRIAAEAKAAAEEKVAAAKREAMWRDQQAQYEASLAAQYKLAQYAAMPVPVEPIPPGIRVYYVDSCGDRVYGITTTPLPLIRPDDVWAYWGNNSVKQTMPRNRVTVAS